MAEEAFKIRITADNKEALAALQQTVKSLDGVEIASVKASGKVVKMGKDFTGLSRVIQDLPYGFNAIANNLTNILPAAGALGLGISALVAGLQFASLGFGAWTRGLDGAKKSTEDAAKANEDYVNSLAKEKTQLDLLFRTASNANLPMEARVNAIKTLRNEMGAYLKDVTDEKLLAGEAADAYEKLSVAIVKAAKARAAQLKIQAKQSEILDLEQKDAEAQALAAEERSKIKGPAKFDFGTTSGMQYTPSTVSMAAQFLVINKQLNNTLNTNKERVKQLNAEIENLGKTYDENVTKPLTEGTTKTNQGIKNTIDSVKELNAEYENQIAIFHRLRDARIKAQGQGALGTIMPERDKAKDLTNLKLTTDGNAALNQVLLAQSDINDENLKKQELANNLTNVAINSLNGLFTAMQQGQSMGEALGNMFKRLAIDIALAAAKAAIFQAIMLALPGGGAAAGAAGGAAGGAAKGGGFLKLFAKALGFGFANGGTVSGPKSGYPVMLHGTEHIVRPDQMRSIIASASQMGGGNSRVIVEGRISGQDIWLSQQRTNTFRALTT